MGLLPPTVQIIEILWTAAALFGLVCWIVNFRIATRSWRAVKIIGGSAGTRLYSKWAIEQATINIFVEIMFTTIGGISLFTYSSIGGFTKYVYGTMLIIASVALSYKAFRWQVVDKSIRTMEE